MLPEVAVFGGDDSDSDDVPVTEGRVISPLIEVEITEDNDEEAEESCMDTEDVSDTTGLKGVDVGEDCATLLVEGPVPLGTI